MVVSVRLFPEEVAKLNDIIEYLDTQWTEIFINDPTTKSQAVRACIDFTWKELQIRLQRES